MILTDGSILVSTVGVEELMAYGVKAGLNIKRINYSGDIIHFDIVGSAKAFIKNDPDVRKVDRLQLWNELQHIKKGTINFKRKSKT